MADAHFPTLISSNRDDNAVDNVIFTQLSDGSVSLSKAVDSVAGAADSGLPLLAIRDDALTTLTPADGDYVRLRTDSQGALWIAIPSGTIINTDAVHVDDAAFTIATDSINAIGAVATSDSVDAGDVGALRMLTNRALVATIEDANGDGIAVDASGNLAVDLPSNSETNPIFVQPVDTAVSGTEVHDYDTATVAGDGTSNHTYVTANTTFLLKKVLFAASGDMKVEIATGVAASEVTRAVGFIGGKDGGTAEILFDPPVEVPSGSQVLVTRTNRQSQSQDLYTTIMGHDV